METKLGDRVRDRINGMQGIVTGKADYLFGCRQVLVAPTTPGENGKHPDSWWLDEDRVEVVEASRQRASRGHLGAAPNDPGLAKCHNGRSLTSRTTAETFAVVLNLSFAELFFLSRTGAPVEAAALQAIREQAAAAGWAL